MIDILLLAVIVVCIVDISGFTDSWKSGLKRLLTKGRMSDPNYSFKPFDCSTCLIFWSSLLYLIMTQQLTFYMLAYVLVVSVMSVVIKDLIYFIRDLLLRIIKYFNNLL